MKAKELMIGDWVKVVLTTSHPAETSQNVIEKYTSEKEQIIRCEYIMPNSIAYNKYSEDFKINMSIPVVEEDVYPIPLTKEILKANGFDGHYLWLEVGETNGDTEYVEMELTQEGSMFFFIRRTWNNGQFKGVLKYVHQLQRVLRLCGLTDLANNFKVE